jgi:hypothetical protein
MKKIFILSAAVVVFAACNPEQKSAQETDTTVQSTNVPAVLAADAPVMKFEKDTHLFDKITQGESVSYEFKFKNTGKTPLIISNATATCGCTIPEYPTKPIQPNAEGTIKVVFNSEGKMGLQDKVVTVTSNANPSTTFLHLIGEVIEKK